MFTLYSYCYSNYIIDSILVKLKLSIMKKNMGAADRIIRLIVAAIIAVLYFTDVINGVLAIVLLVLAGVFVLTSFVSFCPLYLPFGLSTCKDKKE